MLIKNTGQEFGLVAKLIHWVMAGLILGLIWLGWYMVDLTYYDVWYYDSLTAHKALGMIVLALALIKTVWLMVSPTPDPVPGIKAWEHQSSKLVHWVLFLSMFVIPVTGYLISTSAGAAVSIFGWFDLPAVITVNESMRDIAIEAHYYVAYAILIVAMIHAGAAMKHQFIEKDGTLRRML